MIAIVCHDAGGAEILSSWIKRCQEPYCLVLDGPAVSIFRRKLGELELVSVDDAIRRCDWLLCGTSWQSDLEKKAISLARKSKKKSAAFLDHWVNYRERFLWNGAEVYPDEVWVGDQDAERIAKVKLNAEKIVLMENPYFEDLQAELENINAPTAQPRGCSVLYVCEPIREHAFLQYGDERYWGYTEEDAVSFFLENIHVIDSRINKVKIRPHPSENNSKYNWVKKITSLTIEIGGDKSLLEEIVESQVIVGCESMAMIVGLQAGKRVVSAIPPSGKSCSLPHTTIEHLRDLMVNNAEVSNV